MAEMHEEHSCAPAARRRRRGRRTAVAAGLAIATAAALSTAGGANAAPLTDHPGRVVPALALGLNVAPWDYIYAADVSAGGGLDVIQPLLKAAGIGLLRYGGGSYADYYDWQSNTDIQTCIWGNPFGSFTGAPFPYDTTAPFTGASCDSTDSLSFDQFSAQAKAIGAGSFVTVNYGSGTPAEAAAWVSHSLSTAGDSVTLWEVGNENYGCWEVNNWLAQAPENFQGYQPNDFTNVNGVTENQTCPQVTQGDAAGTQTLATSYATNARAFMQAMKAADPAARIGVPWAFGSDVAGASVPDNSEWNNTVLGQDGRYISFVDAHYYPFSFGGATGGSNPTDRQVLRSLMSVPAQYREIRGELDAYDPRAKIVVGETGVSNNETTTVCTPTGALFAAGDVLSWLAAGAQSVDWWDMNNYGNTTAACTNPDYGMFTSASPPTPETPYYGYLLASVLARPGARLAAMGTSDAADVLAYQARLPGGKEAVAFINSSTSSAEQVSFRADAPLRGRLRSWTYSAGNQNAGNSDIVPSTVNASSLGHGITLPAESMVILESH
ncbi:MAG: hypothetical protein M3Z75_10035 [Actinomycetota bacterium]|nr:hypothetical protein [Actinomycetota bacterium]